MKAKTAEILINVKTKNTIINNWNSQETADKSQDILDSDITQRKEHLQTTLRVPYTFRGISGYMLLSTDLKFTFKKENQILLSIVCNVVKPFVIYMLLGFLTASVFLFPLFHDLMHLIYLFIGGIIVSGIYFGLFYLKIMRISMAYAEELVRKNL